ncbi:hypothetical protein [Pantoea sp. UBA6567]|uniref:hypothetical protein n=1 Tax=Pantoea sp. UBA6567 TaxID=1947043 RepID=UPI0025947FC2|nr:hypothetical protein [Pantoea sp. UBA6567]
MEEFLSILGWFKEHHVASLTFGVLSAILWIKSATAKIKLGKKIVMVTYEDPALNVNLHDFFATARLQSKYNSFAALSAAVTALFQVLGL